jgi:hypothetical protein
MGIRCMTADVMETAMCTRGRWGCAAAAKFHGLRGPIFAGGRRWTTFKIARHHAE